MPQKNSAQGNPNLCAACGSHFEPHGVENRESEIAWPLPEKSLPEGPANGTGHSRN